MSLNFERLIDHVFSFYSSKTGYEIQSIKGVFVENFGPFDESSSYFELKLSQLSDWYVFGRSYLSQYRLDLNSVINDSDFLFSASKELGQDTETVKKSLQALAESSRGLFQTLKVRDKQLQIKDLLRDKKLLIQGDFIESFFPKEQLFEARVISWDEQYFFGPSFCFHPPEAYRFIEKEAKLLAKEAKKNKSEVSIEKIDLFLLRLLKMFYKREQYKHLDVVSIYSNQSKLGL